MSPSPQPVAPMLATLLREHDFAFDVLNRDLVLSRPSSTEAVVGTMDATDLPGFGEYTRKPTFIVRSSENANNVELIVSTRTNVEQLRHDLDEETRTQQGPFWDVPYSTAPEIRGDVPLTTTTNEDVQDVGKWLDRVRAIQYLAFVLEHAQQDIQRMQVDDETASCKYRLFSRGLHRGLTIRLAANPQATMVMTLPNRERLHAFDQLPSIASIANIGKPGWYATVSTKFHGNLRLTERVHRGGESVTGQDVVWSNGYMAVVAGYVDANGNYRDGQTVSDDDEESVQAESENTSDEIAHPEAVPWWRTDGQLDFARLQQVLERTREFIAQRERGSQVGNAAMTREDYAVPNASLATSNVEEQEPTEVAVWRDRGRAVASRVESINEQERYALAEALAGLILRAHYQTYRAARLRDAPPHMNAPVDPRRVPMTPAPTDSSYPSTATLASDAAPPYSEASSGPYYSARSSLESIASSRNNVDAPPLPEAPVPGVVVEDEAAIWADPVLEERNDGIVFTFTGRNSHHEQTALRLACIEQNIRGLQELHLHTREDVGRSTRRATTNLIDIRDNIIDLLAQVRDDQLQRMDQLMRLCVQLRDELHENVRSDRRQLDHRFADVLQDTHDLRHFVADMLEPITQDVQQLQFTLDHRIGTMQGQYGDLAERVEEHYYDHRNDIHELMHKVQQAISKRFRRFRNFFRR
jgi:hypothetical protein